MLVSDIVNTFLLGKLIFQFGSASQTGVAHDNPRGSLTSIDRGPSNDENTRPTDTELAVSDKSVYLEAVKCVVVPIANLQKFHQSPVENRREKVHSSRSPGDLFRESLCFD